MKIRMNTITVLGANGTMGSSSAAILAGFGAVKVHMLAREKEKAQKGITAAAKSIRSNVIESRMIAGSYDENLEEAVAESDWVFECVAESYAIKEDLNRRIAKARRAGALVSTVSSGLSIARLASFFDADGQKHYYGTHFFNPPYKLTLCELVSHDGNDPEYTTALGEYLQKTLQRHVVFTRDTPAFAGNRIGFQLMNEAAQLAEKYQDRSGIYLLDSILGAYSGRAMSPLATVDLVGLDVHKAIVDNIYENTNDAARDTFRLPEYMQKLIDEGSLGRKTRKGLYTRQESGGDKPDTLAYNIESGKYEKPNKIDIAFKSQVIKALRDSDYPGAVEIFKQAKGLEADLLRHFIARYISYSFALIPEVTNQNGIDGAMGFGFNWLPPSAWVDLLGGVKETCQFLEQQKMPVPETLSSMNGQKVYKLQAILDYRSLFKALG